MSAGGDGVEPLGPVEREGVDWLVRLTSGAATQADAHAFRAWLDSSAAHRSAFSNAVAVLRLAQAGRAFEGSAFHVARSRRLGRRAFLGAGAAVAAAAVATVVLSPTGLLPALSDPASVRTAKGDRLLLALAEGVSVDLNTHSRFERDAERPRLVSGEAAVEVSGRDQTPFLLQVGEAEIAAAAGVYNVVYRNDRLAVTCVDGELGLKRSDVDVRLSAGEQVRVEGDGAWRRSTADLEAITAWRRGLLIFRNAPLSQVIEEINDYRRGQLVLVGDGLGELRVNGVFHTNDLANITAQIQALDGARVTQLPGGIVLIG